MRGAYSTGRTICDKINKNLKLQKEDCDVVINTKASCLWIDSISSNDTLWKWVQTSFRGLSSLNSILRGQNWREIIPTLYGSNFKIHV